MKRKIIIDIEPDSLAGTSQDSGSAFVLSEIERSQSDLTLIEKNQENPDGLLSSVGTPLQTDRWIYRIVVSALAFTLVSSIGGTVWLQSQDKPIPEILIGLGTGALGGLAGLLAPTPAKE